MESCKSLCSDVMVYMESRSYRRNTSSSNVVGCQQFGKVKTKHYL